MKKTIMLAMIVLLLLLSACKNSTDPAAEVCADDLLIETSSTNITTGAAVVNVMQQPGTCWNSGIDDYNYINFKIEIENKSDTAISFYTNDIMFYKSGEQLDSENEIYAEKIQVDPGRRISFVKSFINDPDRSGDGYIEIMCSDLPIMIFYIAA